MRLRRSPVLLAAACLAAGFAAGTWLKRPDAPAAEASPVLPQRTAPAPAQIKIGTVDMKRVFQEYHKTKEAERKVNEGKSAASKELDERTARQRELMQQLSEAEKIAEDKVVNEELRSQKVKATSDLAQEIKALESEIEKFRRRREGQLQAQVVRIRKGLLEDINLRVEAIARKNNCDLVFDKSGMSPSGALFLLHARDAVDFSTEVITELNGNASPEDSRRTMRSIEPRPLDRPR